MSTLWDIQSRLKDLGFYHGRVDNIPGPLTDEAVSEFKRSVGLRPRPYIGPLTLRALFGGKPEIKFDAPWVNELGRYLNFHEVRNYKALYAWLRSDGSTLGDPRKFPWCGDAIHTAIRLTLPHEPFPGKVGKNPYLARNWLDFGEECGMLFGAIVVLWRGSIAGTSGHVATLIGQDRSLGRLRVRGGNQSNAITDTWVDSSRVLGFRRPVTYGETLPLCPEMDSTGKFISTNEA